MNDKKDVTYKTIKVRIKYYPKGIQPSPSMRCDFCKTPLKFLPKKIHYLLCEDCRLNFNKKVTEKMTVMKQSGMGIGIFQEREEERKGF